MLYEETVKKARIMKVIHFLNELKFSGAEIMYVDAAPVFQKLGCELTVVNTSRDIGEYSPFFEHAGYKLIHLPIPHSLVGQWKMRKQIIAMLTDGGFDVVHIHRSDLRWIMSYCSHKAGCKTIYTTHNVFRSHWYSYPLHFLQRWTAHNWYNCIFQTISDSVDKNEREYYHTQTNLVYNWYGSQRFFPAYDGEKNSVRKEFGIDDKTLVIVSVGGCSPVKRHTDIIKAIPIIKKNYPDVLYLHLGEGVSLDEEIALAKELVVEQNVRFVGNRSEVRKYLIASDIYVMPSKYEGIPITTIEAMATGVPCVLYNVPGLCDFNKEQITSIIIKEDVNELAVNICNLYEDKSLQSKLVKSAMDFVNRRFYMEKNVRKIFELYNH